MLDRLNAVELISIALIVIANLFFVDFIETVLPPKEPLYSVIGLICLSLFCLKRPVNTSSTRIFFFIAVELFVISISSAFGITRTFFMLYMIVVAKAALLLGKRGLCASIAIAALAFLVGKELNFSLVQKSIFYLSPAEHLIHVLIYGRFVTFVIYISLAAICALAFKIEHQSRIAREELNDKVEKLATVAERTRIAREIHDHVGHTLTSLKMQIEIARRAIRTNPTKFKASLHTSIELASRARRDLQSAIGSTAQFNIKMSDAISSLVDEYRAQNDFDVSVQLCDELDVLPSHVKHQLFSILKECMTNIKKYAAAKNVIIESKFAAEEICISISDDGKGFDQSNVQSTSFGLRGMRERLALVSGTMEVLSQPSHGTKITVILPMQRER